MNIAIDLTQIPVQKTGIGIHAVFMIREIIKMNRITREDQFFFFAQDDDPEWAAEIPENNHSLCELITIKSKFFRKLPLRFLFEQLLLPHYCKKLKIAVLLSLHYTMPYLTDIPVVVIFPDMTFYLFPHLHEKFKRFYFKTFIPLSIKKSRHIITVSQSTKQDMRALFKLGERDKITAIHLGVAPLQPQTEQETLGHLDTWALKNKQYFLYVGTLEPRKNIPALMAAFHQLSGTAAAQNMPLVIVGGKGWCYDEIFQKVKEYGLEERVIFTGYVAEEIKQSLLHHAFLFIYPSLYEGFGLPILEAMIHGLPVITSNVSSLPEVAGDAALLVNPSNSQEIAAAMHKLLTEPSFYTSMAEKSRARAASFTWAQNAQKTVALLKRMVS